ncbi:polysaccharide deacetylase family protein [Sideroxyarcus emersonii]|nr:polysaccharide deacetylase family protein [Sideroxyarcus emersonii]
MKSALYNARQNTKQNAMMFFPCRNWKPAFAIRLSIFLLVGGLFVILLQPAWWKWVLGIVFLDHMFLTVTGLIPRSSLLGPNITCLPQSAAERGEVAITIDDGPDPEVTPLVLDILDQHQAKATFFCIGKLAQQYPELCREIMRRGHAIENHSLSHHWHFSLFGPWRIHREVHGAQMVLSNICGTAPRFFRATAGLRNPGLEPVLAHCGLRLCSWSRRGFDTRVNDADMVLSRLACDLKGGDILLLHDGSAARTANGKPVILEVLPRLLERLAQANLHSVTLRSAIP